MERTEREGPNNESLRVDGRVLSDVKKAENGENRLS
jgi:hypothetical protein